jgi:hypothetical protein
MARDRKGAASGQTGQASKGGSEPVRRKMIAFEPESWTALDLLRRDSFKTFQELADEAFADLLKKHNRPTDLRTALRQSAKEAKAPERRSPRPGGRR